MRKQTHKMILKVKWIPVHRRVSTSTLCSFRILSFAITVDGETGMVSINLRQGSHTVLWLWR